MSFKLLTVVKCIKSKTYAAWYFKDLYLDLSFLSIHISYKNIFHVFVLLINVINFKLKWYVFYICIFICLIAFLSILRFDNKYIVLKYLDFRLQPDFYVAKQQTWIYM